MWGNQSMNFSVKTRHGVLFYLSLFGAVVLLSFQNCARNDLNFKASEESFASLSACSEGSKALECQPAPVVCEFNGNEISEGQSVVAFVNSSGSIETQCQSELRTCEKGGLTGSYRFASCSPYVPKSCLFDGKEVLHGSSVQAYAQSTVGYGSLCTSETRTCYDGVLSGSANFSQCEVGQPMSCLFDGKTLKHLESVKAFAESSVAYGKSCQSETRVCQNGVMTGSFAFTSCAVNAPKSCLFNGQTISHGEEVTAYGSAIPTGGTCEKEVRVCQNGVLSGSLPNSSCVIVPDQAQVGSLCGQVRNIQGDMRVYVEPGKDGLVSTLEFGTFADNYWVGDVKKGESFSRKLVFNVTKVEDFTEFELSEAAFDDWLLIKLNGKTVYVGPKAGSDRLIHLENGQVQYSATGISNPELNTSWKFNLDIDLKPYLVTGDNTLETFTIVAGGGESAIKMKYNANCGSQP